MVCVVLTGAGASASIANVAPGPPPLGKDLLSELVAFSQTWRGLPQDLLTGFSGAAGFEAGFANVRTVNDWLTTPLLLAMAGYFLTFKPTGRTKYDLLIDILSRRGSDFYFATLNYDLLQDYAVNAAFGALDYGANEPKLGLLKLHGAPNVWPDPDFIQINGGGFAGFDAVMSGGPLVVLSHSESVERWRKETVLCPTMALYSPDKKVLFNPQYTERVQARFRELVISADELIVIGAGYAKHDRHVWEPIETTSARVVIVDPFPSGFKDLQTVRTAETRVICGTFAEFLASPGDMIDMEH